MKAITLKLPDTLDHRLTHFAQQHKAGSKSAVVRRAIELYLDSSAGPAEACAAVVGKKWLGQLQGPADLSTNRAHLKDFGR